MKYIFLVMAISMSLISCQKDEPQRVDVPQGIYSGTFKRYNQAGSKESQITIEFDYPNWTGTSSINKYPALNKGRFNYENEAISFNNTSPWTADFDWSLILNGAYNNYPEGDSLIFTKSYDNGFVDVYKLKKQ